jgi:asparagine synthase (glutamine-hydrolysing)
MPGITGILSARPGAHLGETVQKMTDAMMHENYYTSGTYTNEALGIGAGWALLKGSYADCLPIWNETRDVCLLFSGEHFASPEELGRFQSGHSFDAGTASALVHLYEEEGDRFFEKLNGLFSGLLIDLRQQKVVLFNDRYGLQRIYVHEADGRISFASEAKSLLRVLPQTRSLNLQSLGEYFSCGCVLQHRTLFSGVSLLPPASVWTISPGQPVRKETYFKKEAWERQEPLSVEDYFQKLKETYTRIVPKYFQGKQEVALSLTGGIDSRMVIAAAPHPPGTLRCYSVTGMHRECADANVGRRIAGMCGQPHQTLKVDRGFFKAFPELAAKTVYRTDGMLDAVGSAGMYAYAQARNMAPVRMTGNYGGEVLRGIVGFRPGYLNERFFAADFLPHYKNAAETYAAEKQGGRSSFIAFKQMSWHHYARYAMESSILTIRSPFLDNELVRLAFRAPSDPGVNKDLAHRLIAECKPALAGLPTDRGVSKRPPFLPRAAWEWWKELGPRVEYAFDYGMPDWLVKTDRLLGPLRPERLFLGVQKYCHFRPWYRHELASFVRDIVLDRRTLSRPYWDRKVVERQVKAHLAGAGNCTLEIHKLLSTEIIQRRLIEQTGL